MKPTDDDHYPHWRTALFGNGHIANVYCAVKYTLWHLFHALFVALGIVLIVLAVPLLFAWRGIRYVALRAARRIDGWLEGRPERPPRTLETKVRLKATVEGVKRTPFLRRLYNECPVDIKMDPKWYTSLAGLGDRAIAWAQPPETIAVCPRCGDEEGEHWVGDRCLRCFHDGEVRRAGEVPLYERRVE